MFLEIGILFSFVQFQAALNLWNQSFVFSKAADWVLRVTGCRQNMQVPRRGQTFPTESLKNSPVTDDPGSTYNAFTADWKWQKTVCENLGLRDTSWMAVGQCLSITERAEATILVHKNTKRQCHFSVSEHKMYCIWSRMWH